MSGEGSGHARIGGRFGYYTAVAKIAEGGMALVYLGRADAPQPAAFPPVCALKIIREELTTQPDFVTMFEDEARLAVALHHPGIVRVFDFGMEAGRHYLAMELLSGQSLWQLWDACRERGLRLRYDLLCWMGARVAEALHYAHGLCDARGVPLEVVHRDVNATNLFVTYDGLVKVLDFGLAKAKSKAFTTRAGVIKGKVAYMAPEQAMGARVDLRTDVFALAITLWELSVDRRLFKRKDDVETLKKVHAAEVPNPCDLVAGYPPALSRVLLRALSREPDARYGTALDMARDLDTCARLEGRAVGQRDLAEVMAELFREERMRQERWLHEASAPRGHVPRETLRVPSTFYSKELEGPARRPSHFRSKSLAESGAPYVTHGAKRGPHRLALALTGVVLVGLGLLWFALFKM